MEMSPVLKWNSQQVEEECNFNGTIPFDTLDDFTNEQYVLSLQEANFGKSLSSESYDATFFTTNHHQEDKDNQYYTSRENICDSFERPTKQSKINTWKLASPVRQGGNVIMSSSSSSQIISFGDVSSQTMDQSCGFVKDELVVLPYEDHLNQKLLDSNASFDNHDNYTTIAGQGIKRSIAPTHAHDHVIAERKRRERLTERFIALSAIVPGLKKLDKASVLGDAIKYLKQLRERVDSLEEQIKKKNKKCEETSVVSLINDSSKLPAASEDSSSCDDNSGGYSNKRVAEIEARVLEQNVLIRIHCEKQKGIIPKILTEIDKLHLTVISSNVLPFGDHAMDVTIISQMEADYSSTVDGLVRKLTSSLQ